MADFRTIFIISSITSIVIILYFGDIFPVLPDKTRKIAPTIFSEKISNVLNSSATESQRHRENKMPGKAK